MYSYATGKIEHNLKGDGHVGGVTAICRGPTNIIYTCGEDHQIIAWHLSDGGQHDSWTLGKERPSSLLYLSATKQLLVGSRELKLWCTGTKELRQTFTGHTSNVTLMKQFSIDGITYVMSASRMDRTVSLWRIGGSAETHKNAVATFLMADVAFFLNCKVVDGSSVQIAAVTRSGVVHVFVAKNIGAHRNEKPIKPKATIEVASDTDQNVRPVPIVAALLDYNSDEQSLLLGYGDRLFLRFELIVSGDSGALHV